MKRTTIYIALTVLFTVSILLTIFSIGFFVEYSSFTVAITKGLIGILAVMFIDDVVLGKIDTIEAIKQNNIAYALVLLAFAIIIAACIGFA